MRFGSRLHSEFPHGWWRSAQWWTTGVRELALNTTVTVATVVFVGEMKRAVRHRDEPRTLARLSGTFEGHMAGLLANSAGLVVLPTMVIESGLTVVLTVQSVGWCLLNITVSATVFAVFARSGIREPAAWAELDFVERHAPKHGRSPQTIEEYRVHRLQE